MATELTLSPDDSIAPIKVPGFELRVLDVRKKVSFDIDAEREAVINLPIFIYIPRNPGSHKIDTREFRLLYNDLARIQARLQDGDLDKMLLRLDRAIRDYSDNAEGDAAVAVGDEEAGGSRVVSENVVHLSHDSEPAPHASLPAAPATEEAAQASLSATVNGPAPIPFSAPASPTAVVTDPAKAGSVAPETTATEVQTAPKPAVVVINAKPAPR